MDELAAFLLKGGAVAMVIAIGFAIKYIAEGLAAWRKSSPPKPDTTGVAITDAATTNAILLASLKAERSENVTAARRIAELEADKARLVEKNFAQQAEYEAQLGELRRKVLEVTLQLDQLQARLTSG
jgi:hypothetical protein